MAEYKVTLQDNTVKKLKNMLNIGTIDEEYVIEDNGVIDVDSFIDHTKINVNISDANVHLDTEPQLITTQDEHQIVFENTEDGVTTYSGHSWVKVQVGINEVTSADKINASFDKGIIGSNNAKVIIGVQDNAGSSVIHKTVDFTIFDDHKEPGKQAINLTRSECVAHYDIDEVSNYTEFEDLQLASVKTNGDDALTLTIQGRIGGEGEAVYPVPKTAEESEHDENDEKKDKLSGTIDILVNDLKAKLEAIGYTIVKIQTTEA